MPLAEILKESKQLEDEQLELRAEIIKMSWYMRGGVTIDEAFAMSYKDREIIGSLIKENLETTKKSGLPFY
tara:strand:+ start:147 stop:359 length:213 start_codon:yes stop_codon:yes gene_type:complete